MNKFALAAVASIAPAALSAQVGHLPQESPFRDVPYRQEITTYSGWYSGAEGSAGVGPQAGPIAGVRYEIRIGGPAFFSVHGGHAFSQRDVIDPLNPPETRHLGTKDVSLILLDAGITLNLTGQKSWHGIIPFTRFGAGVAANVGSRRDPGNFTIGTPFALVLGTGVRWTGGGRWQLRFDVTDHLFRLNYPASYSAIPQGGGPPVLADKTSEWKHNGVFSVGASYIISR
ncbi:MAG TPA: hypothetical protein VFB46_12460 [Gemmatimonadaceae bacterium]|nr:hypothetical protein [Gemmatimonadaceae bacterium]